MGFQGGEGAAPQVGEAGPEAAPAQPKGEEALSARNAVFSQDGRIYRPVSLLCHELLAGMPAVGLELYRTAYEFAAEEQLQAALESGSMTALEQVANRYFITLPAGRALIQLADRLMHEGRYRGAVTQVDVSVNSIRRLEEATRPTYQYTTCVDAGISQGLMSMSNVADGVVLMLSANGDVRQTLRNEAHCSIPYASRRLVSDRELIGSVTKEHKEAIRHGDWAHPDSDFVRDRFIWKNRQFPGLEAVAAKADVEPHVKRGARHACARLAHQVRRLLHAVHAAACRIGRARVVGAIQAHKTPRSIESSYPLVLVAIGLVAVKRGTHLQLAVGDFRGDGVAQPSHGRVPLHPAPQRNEEAKARARRCRCRRCRFCR